MCEILPLSKLLPLIAGLNFYIPFGNLSKYYLENVLQRAALEGAEVSVPRLSKNKIQASSR